MSRRNIIKIKRITKLSFLFYENQLFLLNSFHSHQNFVARKSITSHSITHSITMQNGDHHSNIVHIVMVLKLWYIKKAKTKFIHHQINAHLNHQGNLKLSIAGCLSINHISHTIPQNVVYQNRIPSFMYISTQFNIKGNIMNQTSQKIKPKLFAIANLLANLFLSNSIVKKNKKIKL